MNSAFEELLREIITKEAGNAIRSATEEKLSQILVDNDFEQNEDTPEWLVLFFSSLRDKLLIEPQPLHVTQTKADVWEFFSDLQELEVFDCLDYGEWIRIRLSKHDMLGFISIEHGFFQVEKLSSIPEDGLNDLPEAKLLSN